MKDIPFFCEMVKFKWASLLLTLVENNFSSLPCTRTIVMTRIVPNKDSNGAILSVSRHTRMRKREDEDDERQLEKEELKLSRGMRELMLMLSLHVPLLLQLGNIMTPVVKQIGTYT